MEHNMKKMPVRGGLGYALVDDGDYEELIGYKWYWDRGYIMRRPTGTRESLLHRVVMKAPKGMCVDHRNHTKWDCHKENLRLCTKAENTRYMRRHKINCTGYKGVKPNFGGSNKHIPMWQARICKNYHTYGLGTYHDKHIAALMYDFWATYLFGEYAVSNFTVVSTSEQPVGGLNGSIRPPAQSSSSLGAQGTRSGHQHV